MKELIGIAIFVASLYGGSLVGARILLSVREAALSKSAQGLPSLSSFSQTLTKKPKPTLSEP